MAKKKTANPYATTKKADIETLMRHYDRVRQDMDTRRTRKNGWNEIVSAYMGRLPANWPFLSVVTDPRIRTTILEKTARLLNAKLQGRLVPREGGDIIKAKINNALLEFQWDYANTGGSMLEKTALADQTTRLFGASFALTYWDVKRNTNEIKIIDQRDIGFDGAATHIRNARWCQVREFTTWDRLEERGFKVGKLKKQAEEGVITNQLQSTSYESIVKANKGLENRVGEFDDPKNPIVEVITEWHPDYYCIFLPRFSEVLDEGPSPYEHKQIPVAQLRYYPLGDDIYGEPEVECALPLQRAINAILCGFIDEMNISMRPPLKISSQGVRIESIVYGPGAQWIMQNPNLVTEAQIGSQVIANFNATYPALVAAYNTAMGDSSLGVSNVRGEFTDKTATEVNQLQTQQNSRDQYNQLYLSEFLKDIMMMWLSNNKQYLFDDPSKQYHVLKIIGKENVQYFQQMKLDDTDIPDEAIKQIQQTIQENPEGVTPEMMQNIAQDVAVPTNPVIMNPEEENPENYEIKKKLHVNDTGEEAELHITPEDFEGEYDYIPDVASMATSANDKMMKSRDKAFELIKDPSIRQMLMAQGEQIKIKDLLVSILEDSGSRDAEALFIPVQQPQPNGPTNGPGQAALGAGPIPPVPNGAPGMGPVLPPQAGGDIGQGIPQPPGF